MPPLIKKQPKEERSNASIRLSRAIQDRLKRYSTYTNVSASLIIEQAITHAIDTDREFCQKESGNQVEELAARGGKKKAAQAA